MENCGEISSKAVEGHSLALRPKSVWVKDRQKQFSNDSLGSCNIRVKLYLAPMEGVGDRPFRRAMSLIGGFDEACTSFIRVPTNAHVKSLARVYDPNETAPIPLTAQVMGYEPTLMAEMAVELERRGAPKIDLNCGCPSNTVTGRGAGSSLLKDPEHLCKIATSMQEAITVPLSVKIRSGFTDTSLYTEILHAVEVSGASQITVHPRTKVEGYGPPARWELIAQAKELLSIPVVGSGDVLTVDDAQKMVKETQCDGVMIGRGAIRNPWIFQEIRTASPVDWTKIEGFLRCFFEEAQDAMRPRVQVNKLKQLVRYLFMSRPSLQQRQKEVLRTETSNPNNFLETIIHELKVGWSKEPLDA